MTYINIFLFLIVALIYSAAGFGGGSLYLAILSESGYTPQALSIIALVCNLMVTTIGSAQFIYKKELQFKPTLPFILLSIPFSFWSGQWRIQEDVYFIILSVALLLAALALLFGTQTFERFYKHKNKAWLVAPFIGMLSGVTGIGGGIYLAPVLYLFNWSKPRNIAATASFFILVNSVSGLLARQIKFDNFEIPMDSFGLGLAVIVGGAIGSRWSATIAQQNYIRYATIAVLFIASIKIFIGHI